MTNMNTTKSGRVQGVADVLGTMTMMMMVMTMMTAGIFATLWLPSAADSAKDPARISENRFSAAGHARDRGNPAADAAKDPARISGERFSAAPAAGRARDRGNPAADAAKDPARISGERVSAAEGIWVAGSYGGDGQAGAADSVEPPAGRGPFPESGHAPPSPGGTIVLDNYCDSFYFDGNVAVARGPGQRVGDACLPQYEFPRPEWWHRCFHLESDKVTFDEGVCGPNLAVVRVELGSVKMKRRTHVTCCSVYNKNGIVLDSGDRRHVGGGNGRACGFSAAINRPLTAFEQHERGRCVFSNDPSGGGR